MNWWRLLKGRVRRGEPLKAHTTFGIGGPARFFVEPQDLEDLKLLLGLLKRSKIPFLLLGAGSNILADDAGIGRAVIKLSSPCFCRVSCRGSIIEAGAGAGLGRVISVSMKNGLCGAEFLTGIPGTVGGALAMNAGISERMAGNRTGYRSISSIVRDVTVMDRCGRVKTLSKDELVFSYRDSSLKRYIVLSCRLGLRKKDSRLVARRIRAYALRRSKTQASTGHSAGCVFKNPPGDSAGRLIDACGLKGRRSGGACISYAHANFIVNLGKASSKDVLRLIRLARRKVQDRFRVRLEPEIEIWR